MSCLERYQFGQAALVGGALLLLASAASAQECETDVDCGDGFACEVTGAGGGCSGQACMEGEECPPPVCEFHEFKSCVPGPCSSDADCSEGMVCHTSTYVSCDGPGTAYACEAGKECPKPEPANCEEVSRSQCMPRFQLPCEADADCGEGFRCTEEVWWECDAGSATSEGVATPAGNPVDLDDPAAYDVEDAEPLPIAPPDYKDPVDYSCEEVPSGSFYCELLELPCETDADCPSLMNCEENYVVCSAPPQAGTTGDFAGETDEGTVRPVDVDPAEDIALVKEDYYDCSVPEGEPAKVCRPAYYGPRFVGVDEAAVGSAGTTGPNPVAGNGAGAGGDGPRAPTENDTGSGQQAEDDDGRGEQAGGRGHGRDGIQNWVKGATRAHRRGRGCSVGDAGGLSSDNLSLLLGVGLALGFARRRRQA